MYELQNTVLRSAFERGVFIVEEQVTPVYTCVELGEMHPHELDAFCPPLIAAAARKYITKDNIYLHNINVDADSSWIIIDASGTVLFENYSTECLLLYGDFQFLTTELVEKHEKKRMRLVETEEPIYYFHGA